MTTIPPNAVKVVVSKVANPPDTAAAIWRVSPFGSTASMVTEVAPEGSCGTGRVTVTGEVKVNGLGSSTTTGPAAVVPAGATTCVVARIWMVVDCGSAPAGIVTLVPTRAWASAPSPSTSAEVTMSAVAELPPASSPSTRVPLLTCVLQAARTTADEQIARTTCVRSILTPGEVCPDILRREEAPGKPTSAPPYADSCFIIAAISACKPFTGRTITLKRVIFPASFQ